MPKPELMELIGREKEVAAIDRLIKTTNVHAVIFLRGAGGLGKTRLLQEIYRVYLNEGDFLATDIIDFDNRSLYTLDGLEIRIAQELGIAAQVTQGIQDLRMLRSAGATQGDLEEHQQAISDMLKGEFNRLASGKRILLFFDTIEKIEESNLRSLLLLLSHLENGVFLFAGRQFTENHQSEMDILQLMKDQFGEDAHVIDIKPLDEVDGKEYLRAKLRTLYNTKGEWIQNLSTLVKGRPILIELTAEWLAITPPPEWLLKDLHSLPDEDLQEKQRDFETNLVRHITQLRTPMDRLLLILSRIYPVDGEMVEELLGLSREDAEILVETAKKYIFVKTLPGAKITLHDEMRKMVNELVWPFIDKTDERKRRDSRRAAALFEKRLNSAEKKQQNNEDVGRTIQASEEWRRIEQEGLIEQWVEHSFHADTDAGFDVLDRVWNQAVKSKEYTFSERILLVAKDFSQNFTMSQQLDYDLLVARQHNYTKYSEASFNTLKKWMDIYIKDPGNLSGIYNALGIAEQKYGNLKNAALYLSRNLEIVKETNRKSIPYVANQLGYTYRLMGDLKKAASTYNNALDLAMEVAKHDKDLIASLFNNLGYIYGIQKKYDVAENYCLQAADIWSGIDLPSQLARVDISLGILHRDRGNYEESIKLLDRAKERVAGSGDYELIGRAHFHLAWAKWFKWEETNKTAILDWDETKKDDFIDMDLLFEAKKNFDYCLDIAQTGAPRLLPGALHQMSNVYWWIGWLRDEQDKAKARELNTRASEESERRQNTRYAIDSLVGDAEFDYDEGEYSKILGYSRKLQTDYGRVEKDYSLYFGRIIRILGDVAFSKEQYNEALEHYADALPKIQRHGGFGKYSTRLELLRLERRLDKLQVSEVNQWLEYFQAHWKKKVELIHWCEKERLRARLRENE